MAQDPTASDDTDDEALATAIGLYALGELTLGQAAERADVSRIEMREVLVEAGIQPRLGPESEAEAREEVRTALDLE